MHHYVYYGIDETVLNLTNKKNCFQNIFVLPILQRVCKTNIQQTVTLFHSYFHLTFYIIINLNRQLLAFNDHQWYASIVGWLLALKINASWYNNWWLVQKDDYSFNILFMYKTITNRKYKSKYILNEIDIANLIL